MFLYDAWYLATTSDDLDADGKIGLTMLNQPVVIYRRKDGTAVALEDRCIHRMAPLSLGRVEGDNLRCMYHGILFGETGKVLEIPAQDMIPERACVRSYPISEQSGWIWVWMGDPSKADLALLPPVYGIRNPDWIMPSDRLDYACNYQLINDNLTDLGHLSWVHIQSFGADSSWSNTPVEITQLPRGVRFNRWLRNIAPIPPLGKAAAHERVDHWAGLEYHVPGVFHFYNALYPVGTAERYAGKEPDLDDDTLLYDHYSQQAVTPMTNETTRYTFSWGPSTRLGTTEEAQIMRQILGSAFLEDKVMIEAQQKIVALDQSRAPMPIVHDKGVVLFQRLMQRLMREEAGGGDRAKQSAELESA